MPEEGVNFINELLGRGKGPPAFMRMDRASENRKMAEPIKRKCPEAQMEFTSNNLPQQNGKVERFIATMWNGVRSMLDGAGLKGDKRRKLWEEAWRLRKDWWNVTVKMGEEKCPDEKWDGAMSRWTRDIKVFGEICVGLKLGKQKKIWNKGFDGMMVGHSHKSGVGVHETLGRFTTLGM